MGFAGAELRLDPIPLATDCLFAPASRCGHIAQDVREEWPDRIDLKLLNGLELGLRVLRLASGSSQPRHAFKE